MKQYIEQYDIRINYTQNILVINKPIPVKDFLKLKKYLFTHNMKFDNIIVND